MFESLKGGNISLHLIIQLTSTAAGTQFPECMGFKLIEETTDT